MTAATFYAVSSSLYFPAAVALLNSLRLTGHDERIVVLEFDLEPWQRELLAPHCEIVRPPREIVTNPMLLKTFAASLETDGVVVVIDSDVIVTGALTHVLEAARGGRIAAYPDAQHDRWFSEWSELFSLGAPLRRGTYVNSGLVAFSTDAWPELLGRWQQAAETIPHSSTRAGGAARDTPRWDSDQDALNAILMSEIPAEALLVLPGAEASWVFSERYATTVLDKRRLTCTRDGVPCVAVHYAGTPKPWERDGWRPRIWEDAYVALLPRVLFGADVTIRLDPRSVPVWLRPDRGSRAAARALYIGHTLLHPLRSKLRRSAIAAHGSAQ